MRTRHEMLRLYALSKPVCRRQNLVAFGKPLESRVG